MPADDEQGTIAFTPIVTAEGESYVAFDWNEQHGQFTIDAGRNAAYALLETCAQAEQEALFFRYLKRNPDATDEGVAKIIRSLRQYRMDEQLTHDAEVEPNLADFQAGA